MQHRTLAVAFISLLLAAPAFASSIAGGGGGGGGSGTGTVTTTGTPSNGKLTKFSGTTSITNGDLSGDCTTAGTLAITCTKTNGSTFAASATTDTTSASNISAGSLALGRIAAMTADAVLGNPTGSSAAPTNMALTSCSTASSALTYNTSTHVFGCNAISGSGCTMANPTASVGLTAVNGSASTCLRSDAAPALDQTIAPTWTGLHTNSGGLAFGNQTKAFGTTGAGIQGAWTHTDSTTAAGTVALNMNHVFGAATESTPTNAITITNDINSYFSDPIAGTHLTLSAKWGLAADDFLICPTVSQGACTGKIGFGNDAGNGTFLTPSNNGIEFHSSYNNHYFLWMRDQNLVVTSLTPFAWSSSSSDPTSAPDTQLSRAAAGVISVDTSTWGNASGQINAAVHKVNGVTVAGLPVSPAAGMIAYVTDANASCSAGAMPTGGGSNKCFVGYSGTAWKEFGI